MSGNESDGPQLARGTDTVDNDPFESGGEDFDSSGQDQQLTDENTLGFDPDPGGDDTIGDVAMPEPEPPEPVDQQPTERTTAQPTDTTTQALTPETGTSGQQAPTPETGTSGQQQDSGAPDASLARGRDMVDNTAFESGGEPFQEPSQQQLGPNIVGRFETEPSEQLRQEITRGTGPDRQAFFGQQGGEFLAVAAPSRQAAMERFRSETRRDIAAQSPAIESPDVVQFQDGDVTLTEQGEQQQRQFRREQFAESASEEIAGTFQADDVVLASDGPQLNLQGQREAIAARENVAVSDVVFSDGAFRIRDQQGPLEARTQIGGTTPEERAQLETLSEGVTLSVSELQRARETGQTPEQLAAEELGTSPQNVEVQTAPAGETGLRATVSGQPDQQVTPPAMPDVALPSDIEGQVTDAPSARQVELAEAGPTGAAQMQVGSAVEQTSSALREEFVEEPATALSDPLGAVVGPAGETERTVGSFVEAGGEISGDVATAVEETVVQPGAEVTGDIVGETRRAREEAGPDVTFTQAFDPSNVTLGPDEPTSSAERRSQAFLEGLGSGVTGATVGLPNEVVRIGSLAAEGGEFTTRAIGQEGLREGIETSAQAGGQFAQVVARRTVQQAQANPFRFTGQIAGGTLASTAVTPFRIARTKIPTGERVDVDLDVSAQRAAEGIDIDTPTRQVIEETGETTVRGLRLEAPPVARAAGFQPRGRTLAGTRDFSFTTGTPSLASQAGEIDLSRLGTTGTFTAEAQTPFQADVFRETAQDVGQEAGERFVASETIQREALRTEQPDFEVESAEEAIRQARAVPESAAPDVADALRDLDATVFGSASAAAQLPDFRQPRDLDIVVPDKETAKPRLAEALEGEQAQVNEVFDIKAAADVPGREQAGEQIKFGFTSQAPRELDDIPFNPVNEELLRKAGASAFLRQPGAAGTPDIDVGPEPRRPSRTDVRQKDVEDTQAIARELGVSQSALGDFESAFDLQRTELPNQSLFSGTRENLGQIFREERAQVDIGRIGARRRGDIDAETRRTDITERRRTQRRDTDDSPVGRTDRDVTSPAPLGGLFGSPTGAPPQESPTQDTGPDGTPTPAPSGPTNLGPFGGPPTSPPGGGGPEPTSTPIPGVDLDPGPPPSPGPSPGPDPGPTPGPNPFTTPQPGPGPGPSPSPDPNQPSRSNRRLRRDGDRDTDDERGPLFTLAPEGQEFENPVASGAAFLGIGTGGQQDFGGALIPGGEAAPTDEQDLEQRRGVSLFGGEML